MLVFRSKGKQEFFAFLLRFGFSAQSTFDVGDNVLIRIPTDKLNCEWILI